MSVHNLRDMYHMFEGNTEPLPYVVSFDNALKEAVEADPAIREEKMAAICKRGDAKQAHPFMDHLMPVFIAAGAASEDRGCREGWQLAPAFVAADSARIVEVADAFATGLAQRRALMFGAEQVLIQHYGLWDLLESRAAARASS